MKRRLNVLCVLVILVLSYSVLESAYMVGLGVGKGIEIGVEAGLRSQETSKPVAHDFMLKEIDNLKVVALMPEEFLPLPDSVYNEKSGTYVPAMFSQIAVCIPAKPNVWHMLITHLSPFLSIFTTVIAVILFVKIIISINKSDIFNWKNVRRLRWLGRALIIGFLAEVLPILVTYIEISDQLSIPGYSFHMSELVPLLTLVLGIVALIVAEVFAIGLRMKEEQELTI